jgi:hypothetical protein
MLKMVVVLSWARPYIKWGLRYATWPRQNGVGNTAYTASFHVGALWYIRGLTNLGLRFIYNTRERLIKKSKRQLDEE